MRSRTPLSFLVAFSPKVVIPVARWIKSLKIRASWDVELMTESFSETAAPWPPGLETKLRWGLGPKGKATPVGQGPRRPLVKNVILEVTSDLGRFQAYLLVARAGAA